MRRLFATIALFALVACNGQPEAKLPTTTITITRHKEAAQPIRMNVEIADDVEERAYGLMDRSYLPEDKGMLFVFEKPAIQKFWMRDTLIPLDMVFLDEKGTILHIHKNAIPHDETPISSRFPASMVLEMNAGLAKRWELIEGDIITVEKSAIIN